MGDLGELCSGRILASKVVGGENGGARGPQGLKLHLQRGLVGLGVACGGLYMEHGRRWRWPLGAAVFRRVLGGADELWSIGGAR